MTLPVGIKALSVSYPSVLRTNDYWRKNHPEMVANAEAQAIHKVWTGRDKEGPSAMFDEAMRPYLDDLFRGTVARRVLGPGEDSMWLEERALRDAVAAASMDLSEIDLLISVSFLAESVGAGNATYLAQRLGMRASAAFNLETCCSGALVGLQTALGLVASGQHRNAAVTVSCCYSRTCEPTNGLSWTSADGAGCFVVAPTSDGSGYLGGKTLNTGVTCGALYFELVLDPVGAPRVRLTADPAGGRVLRDTAAQFLRECSLGACEKAGVPLSDIDFFVFNTPTAWYARFCCKVLGVDPERTVDTYPLYANTGPALTTGNLFHALYDKRIRPGDKVLVYSVGSLSSASAAVFRWGQTALGPLPEPPRTTE